MKNEKDDLLEYDEDDAVKFIREKNPGLSLDDDQINYLIDLIYDYYDDRGFLDENSDETVEIADDDLMDYVVSNVKKDGVYTIDEKEIALVVEGELGYCDSLGVFEN
ncbi:MAG: hypothetical protein LUC18_02460 [Porphyromonadaceae bacterium]|nr:hypothetical protein [Porphyromonadaceae bacterium]